MMILSLALLDAKLAEASWLQFDRSLCQQTGFYLEIQNQGSQEQTLWLISQNTSSDGEKKDLVQKIALEKSLKINDTEILGTDPLIEIYSSDSIQARGKCLGTHNTLQQTEPAWILLNGSKQISSDLSITNLGPKQNLATLVFADGSTKKINFSSFGQTQLLNTEKRAVLIKADAKLILSSKTKAEKMNWFSIPLPLKAQAHSHYFEVSNLKNSESFIVRVDNPELLKRAQAAITSGRKLIVVGYIESGHGEHNRNLSDGAKNPWSWHVSRLADLNDFASIECDGSPHLTERFLQQKLAGDKRICFWNYHIKRELSLSEVQTGRGNP